MFALKVSILRKKFLGTLRTEILHLTNLPTFFSPPGGNVSTRCPVLVKKSLFVKKIEFLSMIRSKFSKTRFRQSYRKVFAKVFTVLLLNVRIWKKFRLCFYDEGSLGYLKFGFPKLAENLSPNGRHFSAAYLQLIKNMYFFEELVFVEIFN